jgi:hypothetical protein
MIRRRVACTVDEGPSGEIQQGVKREGSTTKKAYLFFRLPEESES